MSYHDYVTLISSLLGSGGLLGAVYLLMKLRPEAGMMVVKGAEGVVVMQANYIKKLEDRVEQLEKMVEEIEPLRKQVAELVIKLRAAENLLGRFGNLQGVHDGEIKDLQNH